MAAVLVSFIWTAIRAKLFDSAEKLAKKAGDEYVTAERLLLALTLLSGSKAAGILKKSGLTAQKLNTAINEIRKGRAANSPSAEDSYDALKKYSRDLTEAAKDGKLDPVIGRDEEIRRTIQVLSLAGLKIILYLLASLALVKLPSPRD